MTDQTDQPAPKRKRRRAAASPGHLDVAPASVGQGAQIEAANATSTPVKRRAPRKRTVKKTIEAVSTPMPLDAAAVERSKPEIHLGPDLKAALERQTDAQAASAEVVIDESKIALSPAMPSFEVETNPEQASKASTDRVLEAAMPDMSLASFESSTTLEAPSGGERSGDADDVGAEATTESGERHAANDDGGPPRGPMEPPPSDQHHQHGWVYAAMGVFVLALLFGAWGVWTTWFAGEDRDVQDVASLSRRTERLNQEISTLKRSDQISREANRDLQRTLAERDEEIAGLRADVAFYERFVGATGQRRGLSVHDLDMQLQSGEAWRFVATLTQNLNRGAVNTGRLTVSVEGTRNGRLERLSWAKLRQQNNAPGTSYSFKYFQQVEGDLILPKDFKPVRVIVRLVPGGGSAIEQSFTWAETLEPV